MNFPTVLAHYNQLLKLNRFLQSKLTDNQLKMTKFPPHPIETPPAPSLASFAQNASEIIFHRLNHSTCLAFSRNSADKIFVGLAVSTVFGVENAIQIGIDFFNPQHIITMKNLQINSILAENYTEKTSRTRLNYNLYKIYFQFNSTLLNLQLLCQIVWKYLQKRISDPLYAVDPLCEYVEKLENFTEKSGQICYFQAEKLIILTCKSEYEQFLVSGEILIEDSFCVCRVNGSRISFQISSFVEDLVLEEAEMEVRRLFAVSQWGGDVR